MLLQNCQIPVENRMVRAKKINFFFFWHRFSNCCSMNITLLANRYFMHGKLSEVDYERSFFPEASGAETNYSQAHDPYQGPIQFSSQPQDHRESHSFDLGPDYKSAEPIKPEKEDQPHKPLHHFFGKWMIFCASCSSLTDGGGMERRNATVGDEFNSCWKEVGSHSRRRIWSFVLTFIFILLSLHFTFPLWANMSQICKACFLTGSNIWICSMRDLSTFCNQSTTYFLLLLVLFWTSYMGPTKPRMQCIICTMYDRTWCTIVIWYW